MAEVEHGLKSQLRRADITQKQVAEKLKRPYSTIVSWMNGFSPLPAEIRREILQMIKEKES